MSFNLSVLCSRKCKQKQLLLSEEHWFWDHTWKYLKFFGEGRTIWWSNTALLAYLVDICYVSLVCSDEGRPWSGEWNSSTVNGEDSHIFTPYHLRTELFPGPDSLLSSRRDKFTIENSGYLGLVHPFWNCQAQSSNPESISGPRYMIYIIYGLLQF